MIVSRDAIWAQFGAAIDMLEDGVKICPEKLWADRSLQPEIWALVHHTIFWLDLYLSGAVEGFAPPAPFGLEELDPGGRLPPRVYTQRELLAYLAHCRHKCHATLAELTEERARARCRFGWGESSFEELLLYNLRHVQHGAAQVNLLLRLHADVAGPWIKRARGDAAGADS